MTVDLIILTSDCGSIGNTLRAGKENENILFDLLGLLSKININIHQ